VKKEAIKKGKSHPFTKTFDATKKFLKGKNFLKRVKPLLRGFFSGGGGVIELIFIIRTLSWIIVRKFLTTRQTLLLERLDSRRCASTEKQCLCEKVVKRGLKGDKRGIKAMHYRAHGDVLSSSARGSSSAPIHN